MNVPIRIYNITIIHLLLSYLPTFFLLYVVKYCKYINGIYKRNTTLLNEFSLRYRTNTFTIYKCVHTINKRSKQEYTHARNNKTKSGAFTLYTGV